MTIIISDDALNPARSTLLGLIQEFCRRTGLGIPLTVTGSPTPQVQQFVGLLNEELEEITNEISWQEMQGECVFETVVGESQGTADSLAGEPVNFIINDTLWNRSELIPLWGPIGPQGWQQVKSMTTASPHYGYRLWNDRLHLYPAPPAGLTMSFEYNRRFAVIPASAPATTKQYFTADTDTCVFPDDHLLAALRWRWKREKGLTYAEDKARYNAMLSGKKARNTPKEILSMSCPRPKGPAIYVPAGTWVTGGT